MAQLWGGRFTKETDRKVYEFNASIGFDQRLYKQDIKGSIAHVTMLEKQNILTGDEKNKIIDGLNGILEDIDTGKLPIDSKYEDIHSFVEANLIDRIGDAGKKLHTGRSRNDSPLSLLICQCADLIISTAKFISSCKLHIFRFKIHFGTCLFRKIITVNQLGLE